MPTLADRPNHPRERADIAYFSLLLTFLIEHIERKTPHHAIAAKLNDRQILTPSGRPWNVGVLKRCLYKLRRPADRYASRVMQALAYLVLVGAMTKEQAAVLMHDPRRSRTTD